jgi:CCR4-NOT transcription complex subunit 4
MWCWHRIRETESGLCPACRTPYGEDPHQFTALDVEEVLKANKAHAAAKKDRSHSTSTMIHSMHSHNHILHESTTAPVDHDNQSTNSTDTPKDRTQLAIMRVIRRNLVYTVGLPPKLASEEILRKPDYFGQYGKIAKIVLNRSQVQADGPESRRSASAYVTFQYKQDALTCILALDGFFFENRNIRASFGTSKYCSAFIKNVRCSNPECTYLHELGAPEDTFTKQEIQAGYVTSGKDVLARQQQIMEEQLQLAGSGNGARKRIGCGGPSGTGRACPNPVFPPPEYDESLRIQPEATRPAVPKRSSVSQLPMPAINTATLRGKVNRSSSVGTAVRGSPPVAAVGGLKKTVSSSNSTLTGISAASVVAGARSASKEPPENTHSTLTTLTPLVKRPTVKSSTVATTITTNPKTLVDNKLNNGRGLGVLHQSQASTSIRPVEGAQIGGSIIGPRSSQAQDGIGSYTDSMLSPSDPIFTEPRSSMNPYTGSMLNTTGRGTSVSHPIPDTNNTLIGGTLLPTSTGLSAVPSQSATGAIDAGIIGRRPVSTISNIGSSDLASLLGINLPSGSGSLEGWWGTSNGMAAPSPLAALNGQPHFDPPLTQNNLRDNNGSPLLNGGLIGGVPIGGRNPIAGPSRPVANGSMNYDMAVLQSLLPNVNVTSESSLAGGTPSWLTSAIGGEPLHNALHNNWNGDSGGGTFMDDLQPPPAPQTTHHHGTIGGGNSGGGQRAQSSRMW